jgi:hypothetical protein
MVLRTTPSVAFERDLIKSPLNTKCSWQVIIRIGGVGERLETGGLENRLRSTGAIVFQQFALWKTTLRWVRWAAKAQSWSPIWTQHLPAETLIDFL